MPKYKIEIQKHNSDYFEIAVELRARLLQINS